MLSRRTALLAYATAMLPASVRASASAFAPIAAGAIRWDAWEAAGTTAYASAKATLSPIEYENRAPFCASLESANNMTFVGCNTQTAMDAEIAYAADAGLHFWAYCWYGATDPMMNAWRLHQSSSRWNRVNWCILLQFSRMGGAAAFCSMVSTYVGYFLGVNYQKLLLGRPLLFIFIDNDAHLATAWNGNWDSLRAALNVLRDQTIRAGLPAPYIVIMAGCPRTAQSVMSQVGADAISNYLSRVPSGEPATYQALDSSVRAFWVSMAATQAPIVPICMTGWDTRPRKQYPPPWQKDRKPGADMNKFVAAGTPNQIAAHLQAAINYINTYASSCPSRSLLIYSWNECDEGGSALVPTFSSNGPDPAILNAVARVLRKK